MIVFQHHLNCFTYIICKNHYVCWQPLVVIVMFKGCLVVKLQEFAARWDDALASGWSYFVGNSTWWCYQAWREIRRFCFLLLCEKDPANHGKSLVFGNIWYPFWTGDQYLVPTWLLTLFLILVVQYELPLFNQSFFYLLIYCLISLPVISYCPSSHHNYYPW